jgi:hypothetical protein
VDPEQQLSRLILTPILQIEVGSVALKLGISIGKASNMLNDPQTRQILTKALEQSFHETVDSILRELSRIPTESFSTVRDALVKLPDLGIAKIEAR